MTEPRAIAIIRDYEDLQLALRKRAEYLNVSRQVIDDVSGLQSGYSSKLLANPPFRTLGPVSLGPMLGALGTMLILVEDAEQMQAIARRLVGRNTAQIRADGKHDLVIIKFPLCRMANLASLGGIARAGKLTKKRRRQIARNAAKKRWSTPRVVEITPKPKP